MLLYAFASKRTAVLQKPCKEHKEQIERIQPQTAPIVSRKTAVNSRYVMPPLGVVPSTGCEVATPLPLTSMIMLLLG